MQIMVRKQVYLEAGQQRTLKTLARERSLTEAEIIRAALDRYFEEQEITRRREAAWKRERAFIEDRMKARRAEVKRTWRREDLYDRKVLSGH
jgi:hypothetical protein